MAIPATGNVFSNGIKTTMNGRGGLRTTKVILSTSLHANAWKSIMANLITGLQCSSGTSAKINGQNGPSMGSTL